MISKCILALVEIGKDGAYTAWQLSPTLQEKKKDELYSANQHAQNFIKFFQNLHFTALMGVWH